MFSTVVTCFHYKVRGKKVMKVFTNILSDNMKFLFSSVWTVLLPVFYTSRNFLLERGKDAAFLFFKEGENRLKIMSVKHRSMWYVLYSKLYRKLATASDNKSIRCSSAGYCWSCMLKAFCLWIQFISPFPPWFLAVCGTQRKSFILYNIHIHIHIHIHVLHNFSTVQVFSLAFY